MGQIPGCQWHLEKILSLGGGEIKFALNNMLVLKPKSITVLGYSTRHNQDFYLRPHAHSIQNFAFFTNYFYLRRYQLLRQ